MNAIGKTLAASLAGAGLLVNFAATTPAAAAPLIANATAIANHDSAVRQVYWRHHWGFPFWGRGPALVGGVILGGALVASAIAERRADRVAMQHCADDFPSFRWRTGTFINRYGEERVCPYLR
jgi:hypothetical protein